MPPAQPEVPTERQLRYLHVQHDAAQFQWNDTSLTCTLQSHEGVVLRGVCTLHVVRGSVRAAGAVLTSASLPMPVWAPDVAPAVDVVALADDTCLRIENAAPGIEQIGRVCPLAGADPFAQLHALPRLTFHLVSDLTEPALRTPMEWRDTMTQLCEAASPIVLLRGTKNTGKSTFARLLLHTLATASSQVPRFVAWLDMDIGQPEFGPPGMLSLHVWDTQREACVAAPAWCSARVPVRAHYLGDVSPRDDPAHYVAAVADLVEFFRTELQYTTHASQVQTHLGVPPTLCDPTPTARSRQEQRMPLLINTHGWLKGLGLDLVQQVTALVQPSHIVDLGDVPLHGAYATLPAYADTAEGRAAGPSRRRINAAEARTLSLLSYLHMTQLPRPGIAMSVAAWDFTPLVASPPWIVDVHEGLAAGIGCLERRASVDPPLRLLALNGAMVAIVQAPAMPMEESTTAATPSDVWPTAWQRGAALVAPSSLAPAYGLALVRSLDREKGHVHLLTPLSGTYLADRMQVHGMPLGLVQGAMELPFWGALDADAYADVMQYRRDAPAARLAGVLRQHVPYLQWPADLVPGDAVSLHTEPLGARPRKVRRNLMRRRYNAGGGGGA